MIQLLRRVSVGGLVAAVFVLAAACGDDNGPGDLIGEPNGDTPTMLPEQPELEGEPVPRSEFISNIEAQLSQVEMIMLDIEAQALTLPPAVQEDANERIDDLRAMINDVHARLDEAETASSQEFESMRPELEDRAEEARVEADNLAADLGS